MPDISTPNLDYGNMVQAWDINDALMGGTLYMRQLGEAYLPRWPKEDKEDYKKRLAVATLFPAYEETINQNVGRVFAESIQLGENVPDALREFAKNVDLEGSRLDGHITALCLQFKDMVNAKVSIIDTYAVYLDAVNFPGGVNPTANPTMFSLQTFWLDTKTAEDDEVASWSMSSPADLQGLVIPTRQITSLCEWALRGQYRSGDGCTYNGTAYFNAKGNAVADSALDVCGGCLSDCRKRFGAGLAEPNAANLDFGGFPATVLFSR